jgi:hypothetical protein
MHLKIISVMSDKSTAYRSNFTLKHRICGLLSGEYEHGPIQEIHALL